MTGRRMGIPIGRAQDMARHPRAERRRRTGGKHNIGGNGRRLYTLLRGGKPIAGMFRILPIPDICA